MSQNLTPEGQSAQNSRTNRNQDSKNSRISFVNNENETTALLLDDADKPTQNSSQQSSVIKTRKRSRTYIAEQRDREMVEAEANMGFCELYKKALILIPYIVLQGLSQMFLNPIIPGVMKDYFGSDKKAAAVQSYVTGGIAIIGMFTAAFYGKLLDSIGRKPFFVIAPLFQAAIPNLLLAVFRSEPIFYMIAKGAGGLIQASFTSSYIADNYSSKTRVKVFAMVNAVGNLTALFVIVVAFFSETICIIVAVVFSFLTVVYAFFFIQESIPTEKEKITSELCCHNPFSTMKFLLKSKVCRGVVAIIACFLFAQVGTGDIYMYFLNERVGFNKADNAYVFFEDGILTPLVLLVLLPFLSKRISPTMIIFISLIALILELVVIATIWAKWPIFAFVIPLVSLTMMMAPILLTVLSNSGSPADQGRRLTGFQAIADLCDAIGPIVFGAVYGNVSGTLVVLPFVIAAVIACPAGIVTFKLPQWIEEENDEKELRALERQRSSAPNSVQNSVNNRM